MRKTQVLVAGHGKEDAGAIGNGYVEAELNRQVVKSIYEKLQEEIYIEIYDVEKRLSRTQDHQQFQGKEVTEIHFNSFVNPKAKGTEVLIKKGYTADATDIAIMQALGKHFIHRGIKQRDDLYNMNVFAKLGITYRLIEVCFISNTEDMQYFITHYDNIINDIAVAIKTNAERKTLKKSEISQAKQDIGLKVVLKESADYYATGETIPLRYKGKEYMVQQIKEDRILLAEISSWVFRKDVIGVTEGSAHYPIFHSHSIVEGLRSIQVDSSFENRQQIAMYNGINDYRGTYSQNVALLQLAKNGKLRRK